MNDFPLQVFQGPKADHLRNTVCNNLLPQDIAHSLRNCQQNSFILLNFFGAAKFQRKLSSGARAAGANGMRGCDLITAAKFGGVERFVGCADDLLRRLMFPGGFRNADAYGD